MLLWLYRILYGIALIFVLPILLWKRIFRGKKEHIKRRLFPKIRYPVPGAGPLVWAHAVSVGEVYAMAPVIKGLLRSKPMFRVVVSTITQTGHEAAKKAIPEAEAHVFLPFDFLFSIRRALHLGTPSLVIFSEGDIWPLFAHEVKARGAVVAVVNGKISDRTTARFRKFRLFGRWLYSFVDLFCVQDQTFYERFLELGVPQEALHVTGNTKADVTFPLLTELEKAAFRSSLGVRTGDRLIVMGSTHSPEEEELLIRLMPLLRIYSDVKIALVPRHPERFLEVFHAAQQKSDSVALLSTYDGVLPWNIIVVDKLGMLTKLYQLSTIAIVCGSFTDRVGGHNILEPASVGVPVLVGPYMHSQQTLFQSATAAHAICQVSYDDVAHTIEHFLTNEQARRQAADQAFHWAQTLRGATDRTVHILVEAIEKK